MQKVPLNNDSVSFQIPDETALLFQTALQDVVRSSAISMADLRECVKACARSLRESNADPAQMILSMKACARHGRSHHPQTGQRESSNADFLMEIIVKWAIIEYYRDA
jgi:hypothetical protein